MKRFAELYRDLDRSTATLDKRAALIAYFDAAPRQDLAWALWLLSGNKLGRIANQRELREWIASEAALPLWLIDDSYDHVGDLAETLTLLLDDPPLSQVLDLPLHVWIEQRLAPTAGAAPEARETAIRAGWASLGSQERFVFNKLVTGALRVGVSQRLVQQALAEWSGIDIALIAQRMLGGWNPSPQFVERLLSAHAIAEDRQQPYPFFLASALEPAASQPAGLGPIADWLLEWKWDGIRLQLIHRRGEVVLWSRGEERLDGRFPEIENAARRLPRDCVLDGELLGWRTGEDGPLPFTALQTRIQRRKPGPKVLADTPARMLVYDLLELDGEDWRQRPLSERRQALAALLHSHGDPMLQLSAEVEAGDWDQAAGQREQARERGVEGLMLKRRSSTYQVGRRRGDWWKWKVEPLTIDAVLIYAQAGHGRRSTLFTDYTFALWQDGELVPVAKAYSGLNDEEIARLDRWIRANTLERFGPVRSVVPEHVFELGFEAVNRSARHKSGIAVRFPRILHWRHDKPASEADRIETLKALAL